jgi:O-antigen ligase
MSNLLTPFGGKFEEERIPFDGKYDRNRTSAHTSRVAMDEGKQTSTLQGAKAILAWNYISFFLVLLPLYLPSWDVVANNLRYVMFNCVLVTSFTWWRLGAPVKLIWPVRFLLLVQVWLTICSFLAATQLGRTNDFETSNYFLIMAFLYYVNAVIVSHIWHGFRQQVQKILLFTMGASALLGFLQFLKIPPAMYLARIYNEVVDITSWGQGGYMEGISTSVVRPVGLGAWPEWLAFHSLCGWAIIASRMIERTLKPWEFALGSFFLLCAAIPQSRVMYLSLLVCTGVYLYMLVRRDKVRGKIYLMGFICALTLLMTAASDRLGYVLQTDLSKDETLRYRQETGWQQAYRILDERPWTGIGPDNGLAWNVKRIVPDKYTQGQYLDNGFLMLMSWGGYPALALFLPVILTGFFGGIMLVRDRNASMERRKLAFLCTIMVMCILNNMVLNNGITNIWMNCLIAVLGGLTLPNSAERLDELKGLLNTKRRLAVDYRATVKDEL